MTQVATAKSAESPAKSVDVNQYSAPKLSMMSLLTSPPRETITQNLGRISPSAYVHPGSYACGLLSGKRALRNEDPYGSRSQKCGYKHLRVALPTGEHEDATGSRESTPGRLKSGNRLPCAAEPVSTAWICKREGVTGVTGRKADRTEEKKQKERADV